MPQGTHQEGSNIRRALVVVLLLVLVSAALISFYLSWSRSPAPPVLFPPLGTPDKSTYVISGVADPDVDVLVKVPGLPDFVSNTDTNGIFHAVISLPQVGQYDILTQTKNRQGKTSSPQSFRLRVDEKAPPVKFSRNVVMLAKFRSWRGYVEVVLPRIEASWLLQASDIINPNALSYDLKECQDPVSSYLRSQLSARSLQLLSSAQPGSELLDSLLTDLRWIQTKSDLSHQQAFENLSEATKKAEDSLGKEPVLLNRMLLEAAYPSLIARVGSRPGYQLITGAQKCSEFVREMFLKDGFSIRSPGSQHPVDPFGSSVKQVFSNSSFITVRCLSSSGVAVDDHLLTNTVVFPTKWNFANESRDAFSIVAGDYSLAAVSEPPTFSSTDYAVWEITRDTVKAGGNSGEVPDTPPINIGQPANITVTFNYHPLEKPGNLLKLAQLSPYHLVNFFLYNSSSVVTFALTVLFSLPVLWVQYLFRRSTAVTIRLWLLLSALLIPVTFFLANREASQIYNRFGKPVGQQSTELAFMLRALAVIVLALFLLSLVLRFLFRKDIVRHALKALVAGITGAAVFWTILLIAVELLKKLFTLGSRAALVISIAVAFLFLAAAFLFWRRSFLSEGDGKFQLAFTKYSPLLLILFVLAYPFYLVSTNVTLGVRSYVQAFFSGVLPLIPYLALAPLLSRLKRSIYDNNSFLIDASFVLFSAYMVGSSANWFMLPIPFLLSLWVYPRFVLAQPETREQMDQIRNEVVASRKQIIERAFSEEVRQLLKKSLMSVADKLASGELTTSDFQQRRAAIQEMIEAEEQSDSFPNGIAKTDAVLNFGPCETKWKQGFWAVKVSLILVVPFFFFESWQLLIQWQPQAYSHVIFIGRALAHAANWLIGAFFFGYYFSYIQGENGLKKSIRVSLSILLCLLPIWLVLADNPSAIFLRSGQTVFFFAFLGALFDFYTVSFKLRSGSDWQNFIRLINMPSLAALVSSFIGLVGVGLVAALTGEFKSLFSQAVEITVKQLPYIQF